MTDEVQEKRKRVKHKRHGPLPPAASPAKAFPKGTPIDPATQLPPGEEVMVDRATASVIGLDADSARTLAQFKDQIGRKASGEQGVRWNADFRVRYQQAVLLYPNSRVSFKQLSPDEHDNIGSRHIADLRDYDDVIKYLRDNHWKGGRESYQWRVGDDSNPQWAVGKIQFAAEDRGEDMARNQQPPQSPPGYGYPPPGYGYPPQAAPPPGYGYPPPAPGYGYPPPGYGYPPPVPQQAPPVAAPPQQAPPQQQAPQAQPQQMPQTVVMQPMPMPMPMPQGPMGPDPRDAIIAQLFAAHQQLQQELLNRTQPQQQQAPPPPPPQQQQVPYDPYWYMRPPYAQMMMQPQQQQQPAQPPAPAPAPPPPQTPIQAVREAVSTVTELKRELKKTDESDDDALEPPAPPVEDDFPVKIKDVGPFRMTAVDGKVVSGGMPFVMANADRFGAMAENMFDKVAKFLDDRESRQSNQVSQHHQDRELKLNEQRMAVEHAERLAAAQERSARAKALEATLRAPTAMGPPQSVVVEQPPQSQQSIIARQPIVEDAPPQPIAVRQTIVEQEEPASPPPQRQTAPIVPVAFAPTPTPFEQEEFRPAEDQEQEQVVETSGESEVAPDAN